MSQLSIIVVLLNFSWDYIFRGFEPYFSKEHLYMLIVIKFDELTITKL
jgi:hypothetical protein